MNALSFIISLRPKYPTIAELVLEAVNTEKVLDARQQAAVEKVFRAATATTETGRVFKWQTVLIAMNVTTFVNTL